MNPPTPARWLNLIRSDRGDLVASTVIFIAGILLVAGFMIDAGRLLTARRDANDAAAQAARAATQEIDGHTVTNGPTAISYNTDAAATAEAYLATVGVTGTVTITGDELTVTTTQQWDPVMFAPFGPRTVTGTATTRAALGINDGNTP